MLVIVATVFSAACTTFRAAPSAAPPPWAAQLAGSWEVKIGEPRDSETSRVVVKPDRAGGFVVEPPPGEASEKTLRMRAVRIAGRDYLVLKQGKSAPGKADRASQAYSLVRVTWLEETKTLTIEGVVTGNDLEEKIKSGVVKGEVSSSHHRDIYVLEPSGRLARLLRDGVIPFANAGKATRINP